MCGLMIPEQTNKTREPLFIFSSEIIMLCFLGVDNSILGMKFDGDSGYEKSWSGGTC